MKKKMKILNELYEKYKDKCSGQFHSTLWHILINEACAGAFTYIESQECAGIAQLDGGYIPATFGIPNSTPAIRKEIIDELNFRVFGLSPLRADKIIAASFHGNTRVA